MMDLPPTMLRMLSGGVMCRRKTSKKGPIYLRFSARTVAEVTAGFLCSGCEFVAQFRT